MEPLPPSRPAGHPPGPPGGDRRPGEAIIMANNETHPTVRSTNQARQGVTGHNVRYVLFIGTAAVDVIFAALWFYYFDGKW
jgi:hypothetical protein